MIEYGDENTRAFLSGYYIIKKNSIKEKIKILYLLDKTINTTDGIFEYYITSLKISFLPSNFSAPSA